MQLNRRQLEAAVRLQANPDFGEILQALEAYKNTALTYTMYNAESEICTHRGMARAVTEILRALGDAREKLNRLA